METVTTEMMMLEMMMMVKIVMEVSKMTTMMMMGMIQKRLIPFDELKVMDFQVVYAQSWVENLGYVQGRMIH